jgi:DNA transposition AAA+ family ATPase
MQWVQFYARHQVGKNIDETDKDADQYIEENS